jgi:hypothetical protein
MINWAYSRLQNDFISIKYSKDRNKLASICYRIENRQLSRSKAITVNYYKTYGIILNCHLSFGLGLLEYSPNLEISYYDYTLDFCQFTTENSFNNI